VLPLLEAGSVDLVLTDPPYGMAYQSAWRIDRERFPKITGDENYPLWLFELRPRIAMMVCCRWDNLYELPRPQSFVVWDKGRHSMGNLKHEFGRQWEAIAFYPGTEHCFIHRPVDVIRTPCISPGNLVHPNEKPAALFYPLIKAHDGTVLDPFAGCGPIARACKDLGRKCIMIEIEEKYCEIAANRLAQEVLFV
jgi:site-specific DNA-methyltransferase (adenine-specific)